MATKGVLRNAITSLAILLIAGCALSPSKYNPSSSRAMNIYRAGCFEDADLRDSQDGMADSYGKPFLSKVMGVLEVATIFNRPTLGFGTLSSAAANTIDVMARPENYSSRPFLMAWVPQSMAGDKNEAHEVVNQEIYKALLMSVNDMAIKIEPYPADTKMKKISGVAFKGWRVHAPNHGCTDWNCSIVSYVNDSHPWVVPEVFGNAVGSKCFRIPGHDSTKYSRILFVQQNARNFPEKTFYATMSKHLPIWVALYFPPNTIFQDGKPLTYPVVFEKGKTLLFKIPVKG